MKRGLLCLGGIHRIYAEAATQCGADFLRIEKDTVPDFVNREIAGGHPFFEGPHGWGGGFVGKYNLKAWFDS